MSPREGERVRAADTAHPADARALEALARAAAAADGQAPFNDQNLIEARAGRRRALFLEPGAGADPLGAAILGAAILGRGELEAAVHPEARGEGRGRALIAAALDAEEVTSAWAHGDHPAAAALARAHGFRRERVLFQLRAPLAAVPVAEAEDFDRFRPAGADAVGDAAGTDAADWITLNARVFAEHPEQGRLTLEDLAAREAEPWFDPSAFLLARGERGEMVAYLWLKIEPGGSDGEIYVIGVDPEHAGRGLGRRLMRAGLELLRARGLETASLYVDESNAGAVALYRSLGFADHTVDVQYRR